LMQTNQLARVVKDTMGPPQFRGVGVWG